MDLVRIGPAREARDHIELTQESGHHFRVGVRESVSTSSDHLVERRLDMMNRLAPKVLTLRFETALMLDEFFAVKFRERERWAASRRSMRNRRIRFLGTRNGKPAV